ncbi:hypothetical protein [Enhygromyxa salina]|uniref:Uncharacterized protein n=1 Tax=Enhygromyxa salina TaxID=215803 RepID=A0A2S9YJA5_9BACT|nr:hypothetical protein [Enhygromyxa salina]PRQ05140.1 hypothetical protein ENSA7_47690 [Enhygromyxa salina]
MHDSLATYLPRWTKRVVLGTGGRDPLGLSRITHALTGELLRGIITTTRNARYYSIYCWILRNIAETENLQDDDAFARAFRRREAAFALATMLDPERRPNVVPVGVTKVRAALEGADDELSLDLRLLSNPYGGYGQNYNGSMFALGLWEREADGFDEIAGDDAELLALAVEESVAKTPFGRKRAWTHERVSLKDLRRSAAAMSLDALRSPAHEVERDTLIKLLFGRSDRLPGEADIRRRLTLTWILWVIRRYEAAQLRCRSGKKLEWTLLYGPLYFGVINDGEDAVVSVELPPALIDNCDHWRLFCAQQHLTVAHEGALRALLEVASLSDSGLEISDAIELLVNDDFRAFVDARTGTPGTTPAKLLDALGLREPPTVHGPDEINASRSILHPLSENRLCWQAKGPEQHLAQSLMQLASLYARWRALPDNAAVNWLRRDAGDEPWVGNRLRFIDAWFDERCTWEQAATVLLNHLVDRHQTVLWDKGDLRKCWLTYEDGRVHHVRDLQPGFRSSRFPNAVWMLRDLGLVEDGDEHSNEEPDEEPDDEDEYAYEDEGADEDEQDAGLRLTPLGEALLSELEEQ